MIFISGVSNKEEELNYSRQMICSNCGSYDRFQGYTSYMRLSVFFISIFKWKRRYYLKSRCCFTIFGIPKEIGRDIEKGYEPNIREEDLFIIKKGKKPNKKCDRCRIELDGEFSYCPNCGEKIN